MDTRRTAIDRIQEIYFALKENITSVYTTSNQATVVFASGKTWEKLYVTPTNIQFSEIEREGPAGIYFDVELVANIPGVGFEDFEDQEKLTGKRALLKLVFKNGQSKLFIYPRIRFELNSTTISQRTLRATQQTKERLAFIS